MMPSPFDSLIQEAVAQHLPAYDWRLFKAQLYQESQFDPEAKSPVGALGLAQFMPGTWREWSVKAGWKGCSATSPEASIYTGAAYMAHLIGVWHSPRPEIDRHCLAMASYNAGLGHIVSAQRNGKRQASGRAPMLYREIIAHLPGVTGKDSKETIHYVHKILRYYHDEVTG